MHFTIDWAWLSKEVKLHVARTWSATYGIWKRKHHSTQHKQKQDIKISYNGKIAMYYHTNRIFMERGQKLSLTDYKRASRQSRMALALQKVYKTKQNKEKNRLENWRLRHCARMIECAHRVNAKNNGVKAVELFNSAMKDEQLKSSITIIVFASSDIVCVYSDFLWRMKLPEY